MIAVGSPAPLPPDTEHRMTQLTGLVATAVANAQNRAELMTSRARIVAAAHQVCPYSRATRGNIDVKLTANGHDVAVAAAG